MTRAETTLYLVRHGESEANAAERFAGQTDSPLTAKTNITVVRTDGTTFRVDSLYDAGHLDQPPSPEERMPEPGAPEPGEGAI